MSPYKAAKYVLNRTNDKINKSLELLEKDYGIKPKRNINYLFGSMDSVCRHMRVLQINIKKRWLNSLRGCSQMVNSLA